ncbi:MAG: SPASM domain-containing protein [Firmicutes bacterium]|nr:SPASM domain-containing protein [Bacillota bacterium]
MVKAKINNVQVTLDGPPKVHNATRKLKNGNGTFDGIISNIKSMKKAGITVDIRMNVTKLNMNSFTELSDVLAKENLTDCYIIPAAVVAYQGVDSNVAKNCLTCSEYSEKFLEYRKILFEKNFMESGYPPTPNYMKNYCYGDNVSSYSIDPSGNVYKCWIDVGDFSRSLGNIKEFTEKRLESISERSQKYNGLIYSCKQLFCCKNACRYQN